LDVPSTLQGVPIRPFFDLAHDTVFNSGVTHLEAFEAFLQDPAAGKALDGGCVVQYWASFPFAQFLLQGTEHSPPIGGPLLHINFSARTTSAKGSTADWIWSWDEDILHATTGVGQRGKFSPITQVQGDSPPSSPCPKTDPMQGVGPVRALQAAWRLPTSNAGYPCSATYTRVRQNGYEAGQRESVFVVSFGNGNASGNVYQDSLHTFYSVTMNAATGYWQEMFLPESDFTALMEGTSRPLPTQPSGIRCVEPLSPES
jgi:hypothetical protein